MIFSQSNATLIDGKVNLKEYEASREGLIQSLDGPVYQEQSNSLDSQDIYITLVWLQSDLYNLEYDLKQGQH